jgi:hypothetical protein
MSAPSQSLLELEQAAAEEGRRYGCEQLRQLLQAIADEQGALCPSSGERLKMRGSDLYPLSRRWGN